MRQTNTATTTTTTTKRKENQRKKQGKKQGKKQKGKSEISQTGEWLGQVVVVCIGLSAAQYHGLRTRQGSYGAG